MNIDDSVFAIKLYEMEEQYGKLQCRIRICEQGGRDKIHSELQKAREEYKENTLLLEEKARTCRSQAVSRLSQAQLDYRHKIGEIMKKQIISDLHTQDSSPQGFCYAGYAAGSDFSADRAGRAEIRGKF